MWCQLRILVNCIEKSRIVRINRDVAGKYPAGSTTLQIDTNNNTTEQKHAASRQQWQYGDAGGVELRLQGREVLRVDGDQHGFSGF